MIKARAVYKQTQRLWNRRGFIRKRAAGCKEVPQEKRRRGEKVQISFTAFITVLGLLHLFFHALVLSEKTNDETFHSH